MMTAVELKGLIKLITLFLIILVFCICIFDIPITIKKLKEDTRHNRIIVDKHENIKNNIIAIIIVLILILLVLNHTI